MERVQLFVKALLVVCLFVLPVGCDDDEGSEADRLYIGGICENQADCDDDDEDTLELECLQDFKGGYCGLEDCEDSEDCPDGSLCADLDGAFYCFLVCTDKVQCNVNRTADNESNCSANIEPVEGGEDKLCIPPSAS